MHRMRRRKERAMILLFLSPYLIGFLVFMLYPILASLYYSFCEYHPLRSPVFIGLQNYTKLMGDKVFWKAMGNTLTILLMGVPSKLIVALGLALLLNRKQPFTGLFRSMIYIPSVVPTVAVSIVWTWIMNPKYGLINASLAFFGIIGPGWLSNPQWVKPALVIMSVWGAGNTMVMFLAALQDVPHELYEAADIDGANAGARLFSITIPMIKPAITYNLIVSVINYMQYFTQSFVVNQVNGGGVGSPRNSTMFLGTYLYENAFSYYKMGYASSIAWILLILTLIATLILLKTQNGLSDSK